MYGNDENLFLILSAMAAATVVMLIARLFKKPGKPETPAKPTRRVERIKRASASNALPPRAAAPQIAPKKEIEYRAAILRDGEENLVGSIRVAELADLQVLGEVRENGEAQTKIARALDLQEGDVAVVSFLNNALDATTLLVLNREGDATQKLELGEWGEKPNEPDYRAWAQTKVERAVRTLFLHTLGAVDQALVVRLEAQPIQTRLRALKDFQNEAAGGELLALWMAERLFTVTDHQQAARLLLCIDELAARYDLKLNSNFDDILRIIKTISFASAQTSFIQYCVGRKLHFFTTRL